MSTTTPLMTADDLWEMPQNVRHELVKGELRTMAPAGGEHGAIGSELAGLLWQFVRAHDLGRVFLAETGFVIARNPDTVRGPDCAFVAKARVPVILPKKYWDGPPDLAIEVVSPGDTVDEVEEKVDEWLNAGTRLVWIVNPHRRTVTVHRPDKTITIVKPGDTLSGHDVVPGFTCAVNDIFI
jgi:Uma2 family endonuclease